MRRFARETHIRTSFAHNVYNQNIPSDKVNIHHLELIQLSQRSTRLRLLTVPLRVHAGQRFLFHSSSRGDIGNLSPKGFLK